MSHARQLIRDEVVNVLEAEQAALDAAAGEAVTVFNAKILTVDDQNLPAVSVVYTEDQGGEDVREIELRPGDYNHQERELILSVEVMTMRDDDKTAADQADDIANAVENIMNKNITLNGKAAAIELYRVRFRSSPEGKGPARLIENLYRTHYITNKAGA